MSNWTTKNIPDLTGKRVVITGATSGLGEAAARALTQKGAKVVFGVRNTEKGDAVAQRIRDAVPGAGVDVRHLDLADLASVETFAEGVLRDYDRLDVLLNNAGVMVPPFGKTKDGFELQMGTNHFGTFALTGRLMPLLTTTPDARVVVTSSVAHKQGNPDLEDLDWSRRSYNRWQAYGDSKLANLLFAFELDRRCGARGPTVIAAHPGWTATDLQRHSGVASFLNHILAMPVEKGVLSQLRAATDPQLASGDYIGPAGFGDMRGYPDHAKASSRAHDHQLAARLWAISETRTGVRFPVADEAFADSAEAPVAERR
jgi:NAD(P)-dependent dehydrogenase (short-subunit alcohol dehydrogenase family)